MGTWGLEEHRRWPGFHGGPHPSGSHTEACSRPTGFAFIQLVVNSLDILMSLNQCQVVDRVGLFLEPRNNRSFEVTIQ